MNTKEFFDNKMSHHDSDDEAEKEKLKSTLSEQKLYEEGMTIDEMKDLMQILEESKQFAGNSTEESQEDEKGPEQSTSTSLFDHLLENSPDINAEENISDQDTQIIDEAEGPSSKTNSAIYPAPKPNETLSELFKRILAEKQKPESVPPLPRDETEFKARLKEESQRLDELSFKQNYYHKLKAGYDLKKIRWGSPIKISNSDNEAVEQPECSYISEGELKCAAEVVPASAFYGRPERPTKRKANLNIAKYMASENKSTAAEKSPYTFDSDEDSNFVTETKKRKRILPKGKGAQSSGRGKGRKKNAELVQKQEPPQNRRKLFTPCEAADIIAEWIEADEPENPKEGKAKQEEEKKMETDDEVEILNGTGDLFTPGKGKLETRLENQKMQLRLSRLNEEKKCKREQKAEKEKELKDNSQKMEIAQKRQMEEEEKKQKEQAERARKDSSEKMWRDKLDQSKKSCRNREVMLGTRSKRAMEIEKQFMEDDDDDLDENGEEVIIDEDAAPFAKVDCPICGKSFLQRNIEKHASTCQSKHFETQAD